MILHKIFSINWIRDFKFRLQGNGWRTENYYRKKGVKLGENSHIISSTIDLFFPELISIGDNCTLTGVTLLTHDASSKKKYGVTKFGKVTIGNNVFIGRNSVILPCVSIGDNVVIGAGSIITKSIPSDSVAVGVPCRKIGSYSDFSKRKRESINENLVVNKYPGQLSQDEKNQILNDLSNDSEFYLL